MEHGMEYREDWERCLVLACKASKGCCKCDRKNILFHYHMKMNKARTCCNTCWVKLPVRGKK